MKKPLIFLFLLCNTYLSAQTFLGQWRDHLAYRKCIDVTQNEDQTIFATEKAVFFIDKEDYSSQRLSKIQGLSGVGVSRIAFNQELNVLLVGYANGALNLVFENSIVNMPDILSSSLIGDKQIYDIFFKDEFAWLATGFGIVVIDLNRQEVRDTYIIGNGGEQRRITGVGIVNGIIYACSEVGLQYAPETGVNLSDFSNWTLDNSLPNAPNGYVNLDIFNETVWVSSDEASGVEDILYYLDDGNWIAFVSAPDIRHLGVSNGYISMSSDGNVRTYKEDLSLHREIFGLESGNALNPRAALVDEDGHMWIASGSAGAVWALNTWDNLEVVLDGPFSNAIFDLASYNGSTWVTPGAISGTWANLFNNDSFFYFQNGEWNDFKDDPALTDVRDNLAVAIDPFNENHVFIGSWNWGLVEVLNGEIINVFNAAVGTEEIQESNVNPGTYRIGGLDFDFNGNLWMSNSHGEDGIAVRLANGNFVSLNYHPTLPNASVQEPIGQLMHTSNGQVWVAFGRSNGLFVLDYNGTIGNQSDDTFKRLNTSTSNGGMHTNDVRTMVEDLDGEIWVGTSEGITVFYSPTSLLSNNPSNAQRILIRQDGNLQWLLETEVITSIAIDGGNRKWIGTESGGLFLMSEDGTDEILHFTTENSPLFSNNIKDVVVDQTTGEVFIGTSEGLLSYVSDALAPIEENECLNVFPNPVRADFTGDVAIDGLKRDAIVKITDIGGNLVKETTSNGGRAVWNRRNFAGDQVKTGVYLAMVVDEEGDSSCIAKILVIN
ncbi:MAG: hypothetical protein AAF487_06515 [Bacteroidota bacterium]